MTKGRILWAGLALFLVGFIIMVVQVAQHHYGGLAVFGAVVMIIGVFLFFLYLLSTPKKAKK